MLKKIFFVIYFFIFINPLLGQDMNNYRNISWRIYHSKNWRDYVDYKSEQWKNMPIDEKNSLFQIPDQELLTMTTDDLIKASIDCFWARRIGKFSLIDSYYEEIYNNFNGFRALTLREDASRKLIDYYKSMNLNIKTLSPAGLSIKEQSQILEYLVVYSKILDRIKPEELNQLLSELKEKYNEKTKITSIYSEQDIIPNIYALASVLDKKDPQTSTRLHNIYQIDIFLGTGIFLTRETRDQILEICSEL